MDQNQSELLEKLETYREQLQQVEAALNEAPNDEALLNLKADLQEVVTLTEDLVKYQEPAQEAQPSAPSVSSAHQSLVGRTCEVIYENKWYNGVVKSVRKDARAIDRCFVQILAFNTQREYKISEIKLLKPPNPALCTAGKKVQAVFSQDGLWYEAVITEQTEVGYKVTFIDYQNKEEVPFDRVRFGTNDISVQEKQKKGVKEIVTPAGYKIPDILLPNANDTDEIKERKQKKIRAIKNKQKDEMQNKEHEKRAGGWQKFVKKSGAATKFGKKESIFKVTDAVDGKVGVTNSGGGMTKFGDRQKFSLNNN